MPPTRAVEESAVANFSMSTMTHATTVRNYRAQTGHTVGSSLTRPELPPTRPAVSRAVQELIGGQSAVRAYYDDSEQHVVAIVESQGSPHRQLATYVTASLHAQENRLDDQDVRVELVLVGEAGRPEVGNLLATAAFYVTKNRWLAAPGVVFPDVVTEYFPDADVRHLMWVAPFDFGGLSSFSADGFELPIHGLQGMPITDAEWSLLRRRGFEALEQALRGASALHYDLARVSTV